MLPALRSKSFQHERPRRTVLLRYGVPLALLVALTILRTQGISSTFWLHGDQIRDWTIALGPWHDLPLSGTPSSVGGRAAGPVFYWTLWAIRVVVGPFTDYLPHAGGIGISLIQSFADAVLFIALRRRFESALLALAVVVTAATAPFDVALSATIWNPPLAVALVKAAMAAMLIGGDRPSRGWVVATTALGWLAVQAHSSAVFVALPIAIAFMVCGWRREGWKGLRRSAWTIAATVFVLQVPFLLDLAFDPSAPAAPTLVVHDVTRTLSDPGALRLGASIREAGAAFRQFLLMSWEAAWFMPAALLCVLAAVWRVRRDLMLAAVSVGPTLFAVAGFATWQGAFEPYWFLPLLPPFVLALALGLTAAPWRPVTSAVSGAVLLLVLLAQPARFESSRQLFRMPEYGALAQGSREVRRRAPSIRALEVRFPLAPTVDPLFLYTTVLGGRISTDAEYVAVLDRSGHASFRGSP